MSHEALSKVAKSHTNNPNVWFIGVVPRRNPELVVAVLWQNGSFSYYPARIGAKIVAAYVEKQRRLAHNLQPVKQTPPVPVEVGAVWSQPGPDDGNGETARIRGGHFFVNPSASDTPKTAAQNDRGGQSGRRMEPPGPGSKSPANPSELGAMLPSLPWKKP
jgi:hypothetical protein